MLTNELRDRDPVDPQLWDYLLLLNDDHEHGDPPVFNVTLFLGGALVLFYADDLDRALRTTIEAETERFEKATGQTASPDVMAAVLTELDDAAEMTAIEAGLLAEGKAWVSPEYSDGENDVHSPLSVYYVREQGSRFRPRRPGDRDYISPPTASA